MSDRKEVLALEIRSQEGTIKQLRTNGAASTEVDAAVAVLKGLKQEMETLTGGSKKKGKSAFTLKTPKVTWLPWRQCVVAMRGIGTDTYCFAPGHQRP